MFTRCPSCRAAFSITDQQLEIASGMVRCGMCEHVFDARLYLFKQSNDDDQEVDVALEQTQSPNIDLEFLDKQLHSSEKLDQILEQDNELHDNNNSVDATVSDTQQNLDQSETVIPKIIADQVSNLENESTVINPRKWLGMFLLLFLIGALIIQIISVVKLPLLPEKLQSYICPWITCVDQAPRALSKIEVLNRSIYTHPNEQNALMVTVTIINRAQFAQPYPIIQLRFLNVSGDVIAARQFGANHYLTSIWQSKNLMETNSPLSIKLEVEDVGEEVVSYDFDFL